MSARDALRAMRKRAEAATEGPWRARLFHDEWQVLDADDDVIVAEIEFDTDPEFIAHARTDVPALVEVVEAVLEMHVPGAPQCALGHEEGMCSCAVTYCDACGDTYPCPTVTAIETALEGR